MIAKIRTTITRAFDDVPKTKKSAELQEELISNLIEKFNDQLKAGKTEDEAYATVIAGIGDLSELTESLKEHHVLSAPSAKERQKSALFVSIAVGLYILSPMALIVTSEVFNAEVLGLVMMFTFIALATALLIYNQASKPKYVKEDETMVEEFKEWKAAKDKDKALFGALSSAFWLIIVAIYLFVNFMYGWWPFSWIIFIVAAAIQNIARALYTLTRHERD
jgi:hypothetical protein